MNPAMRLRVPIAKATVPDISSRIRDRASRQKRRRLKIRVVQYRRWPGATVVFAESLRDRTKSSRSVRAAKRAASVATTGGRPTMRVSRDGMFVQMVGSVCLRERAQAVASIHRASIVPTGSDNLGRSHSQHVAYAGWPSARNLCEALQCDSESALSTMVSGRRRALSSAPFLNDFAAPLYQGEENRCVPGCPTEGHARAKQQTRCAG